MRVRRGRRHGRGYAEAGDGSVKIELYITNDDPVTAEAQALIAAAVAKAGVADPQVETRVVGTAEDARTMHCLGSPTIRVEGRDVEYGEREPPETTNGQRYYSSLEGWQRLPTVGMVVFAINEASSGTRPA